MPGLCHSCDIHYGAPTIEACPDCGTPLDAQWRAINSGTSPLIVRVPPQPVYHDVPDIDWDQFPNGFGIFG